MTSRDQLIAWRARWTEVNQATALSSGASSPAQRLRDLAQLRALAFTVPLTDWPDDEEPVWERFQRLRLIYLARHSIRQFARRDRTPELLNDFDRLVRDSQPR